MGKNPTSRTSKKHNKGGAEREQKFQNQQRRSRSRTFRKKQLGISELAELRQNLTQIDPEALPKSKRKQKLERMLKKQATNPDSESTVATEQVEETHIEEDNDVPQAPTKTGHKISANKLRHANLNKDFNYVPKPYKKEKPQQQEEAGEEEQ